MNFPANLKYTNDHEWLEINGSTGTIGITDHAQGELGDIVYIDISGELEEIKKGESFGTIEAVKTVADINAPVSGKILEINQNLNNNPEVVNADPYGKGWFVKIEIYDLSEADDLLDVDSYKALIGQ